MHAPCTDVLETAGVLLVTIDGEPVIENKFSLKKINKTMTKNN